jgi:hypothetical protein
MPPTQTTSSSSSASSSYIDSLDATSVAVPSASSVVSAADAECAVSPSPCSSSPEPLLEEEEVQSEKETVIAFDWDDTLLSSSWLAGLGYRLDSNMVNASPSLLSALSTLANAVCELLRAAALCGRVVIITNAETGWVELSAAKFIPSVLPLLGELNIQILSARSTFEKTYPDNPLKWKCAAFESVLSSLLSQKHIEKNVLSFGDSHVEREAVRTVTGSCDNTLCKSVKFAERPTCEQLTRQIALVHNCLNYIHHHNNHLDLQLTVTVNADSTPTQQQQQQAEEEEKMRCQEQSSMPAHDDGCGGYSPQQLMDEDEDDEKLEVF